MFNTLKKGLFIGALTFLSQQTYAQQIQNLLGSVKNDKGEHVSHVTLRLKNAKGSTSTDAKGQFKLPAVKSDVLIVTAVGYEVQEIPLTNVTSLTITLVPSNARLEEVVLTGYSTQKRKHIVGAISSIKAEEIASTPVTGVNQMLQGRVAGVQVSANNGTPGAGINFRIRGSNSINASNEPLYVIDGVFVDNRENISTSIGGQAQSNPLSDINPSDIEDIQVLKDANATAIYGSLGANGVVLITTKRGKLGESSKINFNTTQGWANAYKKFDLLDGPTQDLLSNESKYNTAVDAALAAGKDPATVAQIAPNPAYQNTYDRIDYLFRTARNKSYDGSIIGGGEKTSYFVSFGYTDQQSIVKPSGFSRYSGRINLDNKVTDKLKVGTTVSIARTYRNISSNDNNAKGVINSAIFTRTYLPVFNEDGSYAAWGSFDNSNALIDHLNNNAIGFRVIANGYAEYSFLPELKLRSSWSIDNNTMSEKNYTNTYITAGKATNGAAAAYENQGQTLLNEQVLTYVKSFGESRKHAINALVGNTINYSLNQLTAATGTGFATNNLKDISVAAITTGSSSRAEARLISFFGKTTYTYNNKYTADLSLRADGSSKFGANRKWGYFPSAGVTWRAAEEDFIKDLNFFSNLTLRSSIGLSGNQNGIGNYAALGLWSSGANYLGLAGTQPSQLANPDLTWETTRQVNAGIDIGILKNKISLTADYYNKYTYDLLLDVPVPNRSGFETFLQNYGAVRNSGFELGINTVNFDRNDFRWTTNFNISWNKNKIEKLASDITLGASGRNTSILREGYSINSFYLYKQLYVDPQTGNAVYDDVNGDGKITTADRQIVGKALPDFSGGLTNNFSYKNFDFNFFIFFTKGNSVLNMQDFFMVHGGTQASIGFLPRQLDRWQKPGDVTDIPRMTTFRDDPTANNSSANNYVGNVASLSSRYLQDASFIRLKNVSFGYNLPSATAEKIGFKKVRAYVQLSNVFTITNYNGLDPEVSATGGNQNTAGYDWATTPQPRTFQLGVQVTL
ncbi:TonB-dependent receptor [Sphingobacteriaceae bacterium WQ 2009]|uniref:TonB-dependent receptor n=1 Tax=Rhinopithecimicrobium faecis TaxID=2820698 RepID=A0A8T4HAM8_9SPHI|nr:TonB-dependent receptor [Sphingobacteriaceae bacterium WQ 2009]